MAVSDADREKMKRNMLHAAQVQEGLIPADSPAGFTLPQPEDSKGLPWFFGPDYHPTEEALIEFSKRDDDESEDEPQEELPDDHAQQDGFSL
jgi:hypothetical protein